MAIFLIKTSNKKQRLGDLVAGTTVIKVKPSNALSYDHMMQIQNQHSHEPKYHQILQFNENQVLLMKRTLEIFKRHPNSANRSAIILLFDKIKFKIPPEKPIAKVSEIVMFIDTLIKDYIILSR